MTTAHPEPQHVLYEFMEIGNSVRVAAVDPETLVEVVVIGPPYSMELLKRTARRKLANAIARQRRADKTGRR